MTDKPSLRDALRGLSGEDRKGLFAPTLDDLVSLVEGEPLSDEQAQALRAAVAIDPDAAVRLFDLVRSSHLELPVGVEPVSEPEIDEAWQEMQALLKKKGLLEEKIPSLVEPFSGPPELRLVPALRPGTEPETPSTIVPPARSAIWVRKVVPWAAAAAFVGIVAGWQLRPAPPSQAEFLSSIESIDIAVSSESPPKRGRESVERGFILVQVPLPPAKEYDSYSVEVVRDPSGEMVRRFAKLYTNNNQELTLLFEQDFPRGDYRLSIKGTRKGRTVLLPYSPEIPELRP